MSTPLVALRASADHLREIVEPLIDDQLAAPAHPSEWSVADALSHIGSGAVIVGRWFEDAIAETSTPDDFAPGVWSEWNVKAPRVLAIDALAADDELIARFEALSAEERESFHFGLGPIKGDFDGFVHLRLNEHALHTWDIEVTLDPSVGVGADQTALVVDNLMLIAGYTAQPTGNDKRIVIRTTDPARAFAVDLTPESARFSTDTSGEEPDVELPAEALIRLVYGRLGPEHTPASTSGDPEVMDDLRRVFPGA